MAVLDRIAETVERSDARVTGVREHQPPGASHPDHLIVEQVGRHSDQLEVAATLPDYLVARGKWDEVRESLQRHTVAVVYVRGDCLGKCEKCRHVGRLTLRKK
jgi:hypothetical protein